ncbi:MAG: PDZ domain-containing protein [Phycisphaerae bacterium]
MRPRATGEPNIIARFAFRPDALLIALPVTMDGEEHLFILDTAATWCVFDESLRHRLGDSVGSQVAGTADKPTRFNLYSPPNASLGPIDLGEGGPVVCFDMTMIRYSTGLDVRGIVGMSVLRDYVVQIDPDHSEVRFLESDHGAYPEWGEAIPLKMRHGAPFVPARLPPDSESEFLLDTAMARSVGLPEPVFDKVVRELDLTTVDALAATAAGTMFYREARLPVVTVGSFVCEDLILGRTSVPTLGWGWMRRFRATLDFPGRKMYLVKGTEWGECDEADMSGLHLLRVRGRTVVHTVDEGSPAEEAGIRPNDIILSVNGIAAPAAEIWELRDVLQREDGKQITLVLRRDGTETTVRFRLRRRI